MNERLRNILFVHCINRQGQSYQRYCFVIHYTKQNKRQSHSTRRNGYQQAIQRLTNAEVAFVGRLTKI